MGTRALHTFSVVFHGADTALSEQRYSNLVAERFGTIHRTCSLALEDAESFLERAVAGMDQPSYNGLNTFAVSEAVRATGLKVAVSGQAADELFLGYPQRHRFPAMMRKAARLPRPLARLASAARSKAWRGGDGRHAKLATAGIHTNHSYPEALLSWDFFHLPRHRREGPESARWRIRSGPDCS